MADTTRTVDIIFRGKENVSTALVPIEQGLDDIEQGFDDIGRNSSKALVPLNLALAKTTKEATFAEDAAKDMGAQFKELGGNTGTAAVTNVNKLALALKALAASAIAKEFIAANVAFEQFDRAMTVITGSSKQAGDEFDYVLGLAKELGIQLESTGRAYVSLSAATQGTTLEGKETREIFEAVATSMAVLGRSSADTDLALQAIQQIVSKGVVSMEEMRQQLGERLPGAMRIAATSLGKTDAEFNKLVADGDLLATELLPALAKGLKDTFGDVTRIDTLTAAFERLKTKTKEIAIEAGESGGLFLLRKAVTGTELVLTSSTGAIGLAFKRLGLEIADIAETGSLTERSALFEELWSEALAEVADEIEVVRDDFTGMGEDAEQAALKAKTTALEIVGVVDAARALPNILDLTLKSMGEVAKKGEDVNDILSDLGVDESKLVQPVERLVLQFNELLSAPGLSGDQLFSGLLVTLDKIKEVGATGTIRKLLESAKLPADELTRALSALEAKEQDLAGASQNWLTNFEPAANALKTTGDEAEKAAEKVAKTALELEKLASNERIKTIEAKIDLKIAQLDKDAKVAVSIIDNLGQTIEGTVNLLGDLFGNLGSADSLREKFQIEKQIDLENKRRQNQLDQQEKINNAQIRYLNAQTAALRKGDANIKVNGDGLQPHLEAFMFEILKAIQVRVNSDGLQQLLGT